MSSNCHHNPLHHPPIISQVGWLDSDSMPWLGIKELHRKERCFFSLPLLFITLPRWQAELHYKSWVVQHHHAVRVPQAWKRKGEKRNSFKLKEDGQGGKCREDERVRVRVWGKKTGSWIQGEGVRTEREGGRRCGEGERRRERERERELYFLSSMNRQHISLEHSILWAGPACHQDSGCHTPPHLCNSSHYTLSLSVLPVHITHYSFFPISSLLFLSLTDCTKLYNSWSQQDTQKKKFAHKQCCCILHR